MDKAAATVLKIAVGAAILLYLIHFVGIGELYRTILATKLAYLPLIVAVFIFSVAMRGLIFKVLLQPHDPFYEKGSIQKQHKKFGLAKLAWISIVSWAAGMFTPGKLGEFSSIYLLKKEGLETGTSAAVSLLNKIITSLTILAFAIVGLIKFLGIKDSLQLIVVFAILTLLPYLAITNRKARELMKKAFGRFLRKHEQHFAGFVSELDSYMTKRKKLLFYSFLINVAWIAVSSWLFMLAFAAVGQKVGFIDVVLINSIGTTTSFIPVTIGGTGLREASAIVFFGKLGISNAAILGSHIIIAAVSYTLAGIIATAALLRKGR